MYRMNHTAQPWLRGLCLAIGVAALSGCASTEPAKTADRPVAVEKYVEGYQAYKSGDQAKAKKELESAVKTNPDLIMARSILGEIYRTGDDYTAAAEQYEVLSQRDEYTLDNHYYLGVSYQFLTRYNDSAKAYQKGLKLDANHFKSNLNLGSVYLSLGDMKNAVDYMDKATQINPDSAAAWSNMGVALDARSDATRAEQAYRKSLELEPDALSVQQNLATNLLLQKKTQEATQLWESIVQRSKTDFTQTKLAEAYMQGSELSRAQEQLDDVLARNARYVPALNGKAMVLISQYALSQFQEEKFRTDAVALMKKSLALNGTQPKISDALKKYDKPTTSAQ